MPKLFKRESENIDDFVDRLFKDWYSYVYAQMPHNASYSRKQYNMFMEHYVRVNPHKDSEDLSEYYRRAVEKFDVYMAKKYIKQNKI